MNFFNMSFCRSQLRRKQCQESIEADQKEIAQLEEQINMLRIRLLKYLLQWCFIFNKFILVITDTILFGKI